MSRRGPRPPFMAQPGGAMHGSVGGNRLAATLLPLLKQADAFYNAGEYAEAERLCSVILGAQANHFEALNLLGIIAARTGRMSEAADLLARAVAAKPGDARTHNNYGNVLRHLQRFDDSLKSYERALRIKPDYGEAYNNRGNTLRALKRFDEAVKSYERALQVKPDYADAHYNRGVTLQEDFHRPAEALRSYESALKIKPDHAEAYNNRGNALRDLDRFEDALDSYERALQIKPDYADAYSNRGLVLQSVQRLDAAMASYNRALALDANSAGAHLNRSLALLLAGDFENGWREYEWRWKPEERRLHEQRLGSARPWLGNESLAGKTILLIGEQGLGDTIQFCRYAKMVADLGARVTLVAPQPLYGLLANATGVAHVVVEGEPLPEADYYCFLLTVPLALKTTLATIPVRIPYVGSRPDRLNYWENKLGPRRKARVGLVWSGGFRPNQPEIWSVNNRRNIALAKLAPLAHADVEFFSLQKGQSAEAELNARNWSGPPLTDFTGELADFEDTAALIAQLDLVISVDTSTAHLAGALGKPVWILNRFDTCWRWLLERTDSPWYPTARLYRQERPGDWDGVVQKVRRDLEEFARLAQ